jgi:hypothetical protein
MSFEYLVKIRPGTGDAHTIVRRLSTSELCVEATETYASLKDPNIVNSWSYDLRLFCEKTDLLFLEVTNTSTRLYDALKAAVGDALISVTENDDSEPMTLSEFPPTRRTVGCRMTTTPCHYQ